METCAKAEFVLQTAYNLARLQRNNKNIGMAVDMASKVTFALKSYAHFGHSENKIETQITEDIETVLTLYRNQLKNGVDVVTDFDETHTISCYPDELNQVWTNLIHNALQAMDCKGRLEIKTQKIGGDVWVSFKDSGTGIADDVKDRIFWASALTPSMPLSGS